MQPKKAAMGKSEQPNTAADGDIRSRQGWLLSFWGAKIGDFWEICKRIWEKMRKIIYFVYLIARIYGRSGRTLDEGLSVYFDKLE